MSNLMKSLLGPGSLLFAEKILVNVKSIVPERFFAATDFAKIKIDLKKILIARSFRFFVK